MKVLIGTKLLNLKDCVGYDTMVCFHNRPSYFLIYERFNKISLVYVYMYGDISDFIFYNINYININEYIRQKNMNTNENENICFFCQRLFTFPFLCHNWSHNYFRFDEHM
jgi:hypothetical protein